MYNFQIEEQRKQRQLEYEKLQNKSAKENSEMRIRLKASKLVHLFNHSQENKIKWSIITKEEWRSF
jgi:hypothetical protein